jgi:hypothetical protein
VTQEQKRQIAAQRNAGLRDVIGGANATLTRSSRQSKKLDDGIKKEINAYRTRGYGYKRISKLTGMNENTVKSFCRRNGLNGQKNALRVNAVDAACMNCGASIRQTSGHRPRKFCCDSCRNIWWNSHLDTVVRKAFYEFQCAFCDRKFIAYGNAHRKFCSHECYVNARFRKSEK